MFFSLYATVGSYSALTAGFQPVAWHHLTGCDEFFRYKSSYKVAVRWVVDTEGLPVYSDANDLMRMCKKVSWKGMERTKSPKRLGYLGSMCVWYLLVHVNTFDIKWYSMDLQDLKHWEVFKRTLMRSLWSAGLSAETSWLGSLGYPKMYLLSLSIIHFRSQVVLLLLF